ncbi:MAG: M23 family metallopeptidase [Bacteroidales bacterium]|nr:M23 family metallopeptidase [Bacteroidales bacterium]
MSNSDRRYSFGADFQFRESDKPYQRVLRFLLIVFATAFVVTVVLYSIFALAVNTDVEGRLKRENKMYEKLYPQLLPQQKLLEDGIAGLQLKDNDVYQEVFHANAPAVDPINSLSFLNGNDTVPETKIVAYTARKIETVSAGIDDIERSFRKALLRAANPATVMPPMNLPVKGISFSQVGASKGLKLNPFFRAYVQHDGLDFILSQGEPVYAAAEGKVSLVEQSNKGHGNRITIAHKGGYVTRYAHLSTMRVKQGQTVRKGERIGEIGMTGSSFAPHLHYEVLYGGQPLDPVNYIFASVTPEEYTNMLYVAASTQQSMD